MIPMSVQRLVMELDSTNLKTFDLVESKFNFTLNFESELNLSQGKFSEDLYDYFYNLFTYRKGFRHDRFKEILEDSMKIDFKQPSLVLRYIDDIYNELLVCNSGYFKSLLKIDNIRPEKISHSLYERADECREIILNY